MKPIFLLLACLCVCVHADYSQQQRCDSLRSVTARDHRLVTCSVGEGCFSLDCTPSSSLITQIIAKTDFHIYIEPCKHPVSILVNASFNGDKYAHEFTHSETVSIPHSLVPNIPNFPNFSPKLQVMLDNSDSKVLVFAVFLIIPEKNLTLVPKTRFSLTNVTCIDGHLVTHSYTPTSEIPHTSTGAPGTGPHTHGTGPHTPGTGPHIPGTTSLPPTSGGNMSMVAGAHGVDTKMLAGIIIGAIVGTLLVVLGLAVGLGLVVLFIVIRKKSNGAYTYSQFKTLEEED